MINNGTTAKFDADMDAVSTLLVNSVHSKTNIPVHLISDFCYIFTAVFLISSRYSNRITQRDYLNKYNRDWTRHYDKNILRLTGNMHL